MNIIEKEIGLASLYNREGRRIAASKDCEVMDCPTYEDRLSTQKAQAENSRGQARSNVDEKQENSSVHEKGQGVYNKRGWLLIME